VGTPRRAQHQRRHPPDILTGVFDIHVWRGDDERVVSQRMRMSRAVSCAVALAIAVALSATCFAAADMNSSEMACCASMADNCGTAVQHGCCPTTAVKLDVLAGSPKVVVTAPVLASVAIPFVSAIERLTSGPPLRLDRSFAKPPGLPTYLLVSTFRI
jgi:hypothetical protein